MCQVDLLGVDLVELIRWELILWEVDLEGRYPHYKVFIQVRIWEIKGEGINLKGCILSGVYVPKSQTDYTS